MKPTTDLTAELDTSTPEGFSAGMDALGMSVTRAAMVIGAPERTVKGWLKGERPVHPTAAVMLSALLRGKRPRDWHMTGPMLRRAREDLGMSADELASVLDVETDAVLLWESDHHGPPGFVARAMDWIGQGVIDRA